MQYHVREPAIADKSSCTSQS